MLVMTRRSLPEDCVLERTAEGTRRMRDRSAGLPARLRSVLFLVDGSQPAARILGKAGQLRPLLEEQLVELMDMGLVVGTRGEQMAPRVAAPAQPIRTAPPRPMGNTLVVPIIGAKIQLLDCLERVSGRSHETARLDPGGSAHVEGPRSQRASSHGGHPTNAPGPKRHRASGPRRKRSSSLSAARKRR
jgi:hypothetical protein